MEAKLKELIKEAVLEALAEYYTTAEVATYDARDGGSNAQENSGGKPKPNKPKPDVGVGTFGLR